MVCWLFPALNNDAADDNAHLPGISWGSGTGAECFPWLVSFHPSGRYSCSPISQMRKLQPQRDRGVVESFWNKQNYFQQIHWEAGKPLPQLKSKILGLVSPASDSVYLIKGKDDMAFIALIKTWVKSSRFVLKWNCAVPAAVQRREQQRLLLRLQTIKEKRPFASISY